MKTLVLDHGYVELVQGWGSDETIIEAARMSTNKGFKGWGTPEAPGDEKLLRYLYENNHLTPFEMAGAIFEVQAPIFVFREWHRHRTQSYNELSARYTPLPDVDYVPTVERLMMSGGANKQAMSTGEALTAHSAEMFRQMITETYAQISIEYGAALKAGVPKELARLIIPVGRYSRMRASANLRNWIQFMTLRCASNAQWEIRQYADVVCAILESRFPRTIALFKEHF